MAIEQGIQESQTLSRKWKAGLAVLLLVLTAALVTSLVLVYSQKSVRPPQEITRQASFPIYIPQELPGTYRIDKESFVFDEDVFLFRAYDSTGGSIAITEQRRPADLIFDEFYQSNIKDAKTVEHTPYPTVYGKQPTGTTQILSVVSDETWILITTNSAVGDSLQVMAKDFKVYRK